MTRIRSFGLAHVIHRAVERRAHPLVRIHDERVRRPRRRPTSSGTPAGSSPSRPSPRPRAATARAAAAIAAMSAIGSIAVVVVVPVVATIAQGTRPAARSSAIARSSASARMANVSSCVDHGGRCRARSRRAAPPCRPSCARARTRRRRAAGSRPAGRRRRGCSALVFSRAHSSAMSVLVDAVSWITPLHASESPSIWRSQSVATSSTSVSAGLDCHARPSTPSPVLDEVAEHARQLAVRREVAEELRVRASARDPGTTTRSRSRSTASNDSGSTGGVRGSAACTAPGSVRAITGSVGHPRPVVGNPVDELMSAFAEFVGGHGAIIRWTGDVAHPGSAPRDRDRQRRASRPRLLRRRPRPAARQEDGQLRQPSRLSFLLRQRARGARHALDDVPVQGPWRARRHARRRTDHDDVVLGPGGIDRMVAIAA